MIDAAGDLAAVLDDCGGIAHTINGDMVGRFVEEPTEVGLSGNRSVLSSEPVFYSSKSAIEQVALVTGSWLEIESVRWIVHKLPRADTAGLVRIELQR